MSHKEEPQSGRKNSFKKSSFKTGVASLALATIVISMLSLALPMLTLQVYDRIIPNPESGTLPVLVGGVFVAVLLDTVLRLARARMIGWNGICFEHDLSCRAVDHMLDADLASYGGTGVGEHLSRLQAVPRLKDFNNGYALVTLLELCFLPVFFALIAYIAGVLVIVPLAILVVFTLTSVWHGYCLKKALSRRDRTDDRRYDFLIETLDGIHTLKAFALEDRFQRRYEKLEENSSRANYDVTEVAARTFNAAAVFGHLMTASVIACGALLVLDGHMTSGSLIAAILLSGRIMQPMQRVLSLWARYQDYRVARDKVDQIFEMKGTQRRAPAQEPVREGVLTLTDAGFSTEAGGDFLFRHVNLSIANGETVRISGAHGSGKTALLRMMAGLYAPSEGDVRVDGVMPVDYPPEMRLRHVGFMTAVGTIFRGTIRDNITRFGLVSEAEAREVSRLLGIDKEVSALPRGFDTFLEGTETDAIPPGLRQRIALARVLAAKPHVILFDNADRNLDREGYRQVYRLLGRLRQKVALVLVTDDRNIGRLADRHYMLGRDGLHPIRDFHDGVMYGGLRT